MQSVPANRGSAPAGDRKALAPDVWDRLKTRADAAGGVGAGRLATLSNAHETGATCPVCLDGIAIACDSPGEDIYLAPGNRSTQEQGPVQRALVSLFGGRFLLQDENDRRVGFLARTGHGHTDGQRHYRVPFEAVMAALGIVRGEEVPNA